MRGDDELLRVAEELGIDNRRGHPYWLEVHAELLGVHEEKSSTYGDPTDRFANFTAVAEYGMDSRRWVYPCQRALEKLVRAFNIACEGYSDEGERVSEELTDIASLIICAEALRREDEEK